MRAQSLSQGRGCERPRDRQTARPQGTPDVPVWDRARQGHLSVLGDSGGSDGAGDIAVQSESRARCSGGSEGPGVGGSLPGWGLVACERPSCPQGPSPSELQPDRWVCGPGAWPVKTGGKERRLGTRLCYLGSYQTERDKPQSFYGSRWHFTHPGPANRNSARCGLDASL